MVTALTGGVEQCPGLMVCGTTSNSGKTTVVAGLCRVLARRGLRVAPFKAQNMALNSAVTRSGHEIGRAQYLQAQAARVEPEVDMNPVLLKPTGERTSQVVVHGRAVATMSALEYHAAKPDLFGLVLDSLESLRARFDVVLLEGAGSPAEINLLAHDIVNLRVAHAAGLPAIVVGDIDLGGVFAALHGTVALLPPELAACVRGFLINKFRGDPALLLDGLEQLRAVSGIETLGVLPMLADLRLDAEDSLALDVAPTANPDAQLDVAVLRLPHISNFTDLDPLAGEPDVSVRYVAHARELGRPHLVVIPGSKATVADLRWLRERGFESALAGTDAVVLGICAGYQMLGNHIDDEVESGEGAVRGLGLLPVRTSFAADKVLARPSGTAFGAPVEGYQIHHGRVSLDPEDCTLRAGNTVDAWLSLDSGSGSGSGSHIDGVRVGSVYGTTLHGLFDSDGFRRAFLRQVASARGLEFAAGTNAFSSGREHSFDRLADAIEDAVDVDALLALMETYS